MARPYALWYVFLSLWTASQIVFGAVSPRLAAATGAAMGILYAVSLFLLPGGTELSLRGRLFLLAVLVVFCLQLLPVGAVIAPHVNGLRTLHGTGAFWPATADTFLTLRALVKISTYILAALLVIRLRQAGLPTSAILKGICLVLVAQAFYAVGQVSFGWGIPFYGPRTAPSASGTLVNRNSFAGLMVMGLVAAVSLVFTHIHYERPEKPTKGLIWNRHIETGVLWGLAAALFALAIVLSQSRGGAIAALASLVTFPFFFRRRANSLGLLALFMTGMVAVLVARPGELLGRFQDIDPYALSLENRWKFWKASTKAALHQPVLGFGIGTYPAAYHPFQPPEQEHQLNHPHNEYINAFFEGGAVWLGILLAGLFTWTACVWRRLRRLSGPDRIPLAAALAAMVGVLVHSVVDFDLQITSLGILSAVMIALGASRLRNGVTPSSLPAGLAISSVGIAGAAAVVFLGLDPEQRMQDARRLAPEAAEHLCLSTLGLSPCHYKTAWVRGVAAERRGDVDAADRHFCTATGLWPSHHGLQEEGGIWFWGRYLQSGSPEHLFRAQACFRRLFRQRPHAVVSVLARIWNPATPSDTYISLLPNEPIVWAEAAGFLVQKGLWKQGMEIFNRGCPPDPSLAEAFDVFSARLAAAGQWGMELEVRERRLAMKSDPNAYVATAEAWYRLGAHEKAIDRITTALRIDPANPELYERLGLFHEGKGNAQGAIDAYNGALRLDPAMITVRYRRAILWMRERIYSEAVKDLRELLRLCPDHREYTVLLAEALVYQGKPASACDILGAFLYKHPQDQELTQKWKDLRRKTDSQREPR